LTNAMETQMVRALDVKIGGRSVPAGPMSVVKGALAGSRLTGDGGAAGTHPGAPHATGATTSGQSKCPFSGAVSAAFDEAGHSQAGQTQAGSEGGFPDARAHVESTSGAPIRWTDEATARIERVPSYIRPMIRRGVEDFAREAGRTEVDAALMDEVRGRFGM